MYKSVNHSVRPSSGDERSRLTGLVWFGLRKQRGNINGRVLLLQFHYDITISLSVIIRFFACPDGYSCNSYTMGSIRHRDPPISGTRDFQLAAAVYVNSRNRLLRLRNSNYRELRGAEDVGDRRGVDNNEISDVFHVAGRPGRNRSRQGI